MKSALAGPCRHEKIDFWDNVYGFDFSAIKRLAMQEPLVDVVDQEQVVTEACKLSTFNISDMTKSDAAFTVSPFVACAVLDSAEYNQCRDNPYKAVHPWQHDSKQPGRCSRRSQHDTWVSFVPEPMAGRRSPFCLQF